MKILDILKKYNFTDDVQNNILILLKNFGSKFNIKYLKSDAIVSPKITVSYL